MISKVGFVIFAFLQFFVTSEGIKCWECTSERDYNCGDPFNYTHFPLVDCDLRAGQTNSYLQGLAVCRKTRQRVNGLIVVDRSCAWEQSHEGPCSLRSASYSYLEHCSVCRTDTCNGANISNGATFITILCAPLLYLFSKVIN